METHTSRDEALSALGEIVTTQRSAAKRLRTPWWFWYLVAVGQTGIILAMFVANSLAGSWAFLTVLVVAIGLEAFVRRSYPALLFNRNPRAKRIGIVYVVSAIAIMGAGVIGYRSADQWWPIVLALVVVSVMIVWLGRLSETGIDAPAHPVA